ncbi:MAG: helix-turn-helix transcriptional regulator, partial [Clostridia bacterium]|nr:helix-turn-helix transcriptional regulator [Clostridia bacterium]
MNIKIGNIIRELRRRDSRKQEDLANALGVTCQAVSRWEANKGYPDIEMIPAIANFFHVSIDELFGYDGDREKKISDILEISQRAINSNEDLSGCVEMLREAVEEFPTEYRLLVNLGFALHTHGWKMHGLKGQIKEDSDYGAIDTEHASNNNFWQEAMRVFEKLLKMKDAFPEKDAVILIMVADYSKMGQFDKAKALAEKQNSVFVSRECLMPHATVDEERDRYLGEAIISVMNELKNLIQTAVTTKKPLVKEGISVQKMIALAEFYEKLFDDGRLGIAHTNVRDLYICCSIFEAKFGNLEKAMEYFDKGFNHHKTYKEIR